MKKSLKHSEYPAKDSPVALTFESEIKRIATERCLSIGKVIEKLSAAIGITERQIYNYISGKTDIPSLLIPKFCKQFNSNALAMALISMCNEVEFDSTDLFDLSRFASQTVRNVLQSGDVFLEIFDDGRIDGFELTRLKHSTARIIRDANRFQEIAQANYNRHHLLGE